MVENYQRNGFLGRGAGTSFWGDVCVLDLAFVKTSSVHLRAVHFIGCKFYVKTQKL